MTIGPTSLVNRSSDGTPHASPVANDLDSIQTDIKVLQPAEVRDSLNIFQDQDGDLIQRYINAAQDHFERVTGRYLSLQDRTVIFPNQGKGAWRLPTVPFQGLQSATKRNQGTTSSLDTSIFYVIASEEPPVVRLTDTGSITGPLTHLEFTVRCGFNAADDVPDGIKEAIAKMVTDMYEFRISSGDQDMSPENIPLTWEDLLSTYNTHYLPG